MKPSKDLSIVQRLHASITAHDKALAWHCREVSIYSREVAAQLGLDEDGQELARLTGLVHDIGKIELPTHLIWKAGELTADERCQLGQHVVIGERLVAEAGGHDEIRRNVRHQTERVDGQGHPDGLAGSEIPLISRIIGIANAYSEMTMGKPTVGGAPSRVARLRLAQAAGSHFDERVAAAFEASMASRDTIPNGS
ncbi:MAG TPA: HD domain-containing phosphohydrolase [Gaiellaceae bacterium]|nr:HD domain-containing phosphohydrolase [Gaiellaceae bacterium]